MAASTSLTSSLGVLFPVSPVLGCMNEKENFLDPAGTAESRVRLEVEEDNDRLDEDSFIVSCSAWKIERGPKQARSGRYNHLELQDQ